MNDNRELAEKLYERVIDLDFADYTSTQYFEMEQLENALDKIQDNDDEDLLLLYNLLNLI